MVIWYAQLDLKFHYYFFFVLRLKLRTCKTKIKDLHFTFRSVSTNTLRTHFDQNSNDLQFASNSVQLLFLQLKNLRVAVVVVIVKALCPN